MFRSFEGWCQEAEQAGVTLAEAVLRREMHNSDVPDDAIRGRIRDTLEVMLEPSSGEAGAINPAAQQLDFYIRSPARIDANHPNREVFDHFFAMEVTWQ